MKDFEKVLKAFANMWRITTLTYLEREREAQVSGHLPCSSALFHQASKHLAILAAAGIVKSEVVPADWC